MKQREPVLDRYKPVWLTMKGHQLLKPQKKKQKKSMMQIIEDLIIEKYGRGDTQEDTNSVPGPPEPSQGSEC